VRLHPVRVALSAAAAAAALVACSSPVAALPTHDLLGGGHATPTGLTNGTLVGRAECVYVQGDGDQSLVIWPRGFDRIGQQITDRGNPVAQIGESLILHGGSIEARQYERVRATFGGSAIAPACATEHYWLALSVEHPEDD
jgi:hypothetical protein